jgi:polar amino acid transport system ATP-binding protein
MVEIRNLNKTIGSQVILNNISLSIPKGETFVLIGTSGSGKSTLAGCVNGLNDFQEGEIVVNGKQVNKKTANTLYQDVGMAFQHFGLYENLTAIENILLAPRLHGLDREQTKKEAQLLLEKFQLVEHKDKKPKQLSGGQKQRVAICRALISQPEIMIFDEPTSALDIEMKAEINDAILDIAQSGKTVILVTHELDFARNVADSIVFINKGEILEITESEEFFTNPKTNRAKEFLDKAVYKKTKN